MRLRTVLFATVALTATPALAAEPKAVIQGVEDRALREEIQRAVGETKSAPASRIDARRRAREAADTVEQVLRSEGYYDYSLEPDVGEGERPTPVVDVTLGRRTRIGEVKIEWLDHTPDPNTLAAVNKAVDLKPGLPARAAEVIAAEGRIVAALQQHGYADAQSAPRDVVVDHADLSMQPTFRISAGELVRLGDLRLATTGRTNRKWLRSLRSWKVGEVYRPDRVAELERRLLDTQVYDSVTVALAPQSGPDGLRPVVVSLADRARRSLALTAGYSTAEGPEIDATLQVFNRVGRGDTLSLEAKYGLIDSRIGVNLALPDFGKPNLTLTTGADVFRSITDAYTQTGAEVTAELTNHYSKTSFFTRGVALVASRIDDKELGKIDIQSLRGTLAVAIDRSDNALDPHKGWKLDARVQPIGVVGDESLVYVRSVVQGSAYLPFGRTGRTVLAGRARVGSILGGKIPQVPAADRFFAGGGGSVRGYDFQSIGPHYTDRTPVGGLSLVETSLELRHTFQGFLNGNFGAVAFIDGGVVGKEITPSFGHPAFGVGVGVRYSLGFAPIRADIAFPLNQPSGTNLSAFQVYVSIGQAF